MTAESVEIVEAVKDLNDQFVSFVEAAVKQPAREATLLDATGVAQYKRYRDELKEEAAQSRDKKSKAQPAPSAPAATAPLFSFGGKSPAEISAGSKATTSAAPSFTFGGAAPAAPASAPAFTLGAALSAASTASAAPLFSFGGSAGGAASTPAFAFGAPAPAPAAASPAPFSFGGVAPLAPATGGLFSFGGAPAPLKVGGGEAEGEDEEEEQRPPSPSVVKGNADDDWEEVLYSAKAKLFFMPPKGKSNMSGEGTWQDRGVGVLQVRKSKELKNGVKPARLVMRNDTGKIFLNASLYAGLKARYNETRAQVRGGRNVVAMLANAAKEEKLPGQEADTAAPELTMTMLKVATPEAAEKLQEAIQGAVPV